MLRASPTSHDRERPVNTRCTHLLPASLSLFPSLQVREEANRPQPRLDRDTGRGFTTVVGRIRPDPINTVKLFVLSHNTVMGAAGSSILNAEMSVAKGLMKHRS